jgi:hypothetical protein
MKERDNVVNNSGGASFIVVRHRHRTPVPRPYVPDWPCSAATARAGADGSGNGAGSEGKNADG